LQRAFCENFAGIITHLITHAELKGLKQKGGESLRNYYRRFGELCAQVHDITEWEVIETFSSSRDFSENCTISFFYLRLVLHACVQTFDVMDEGKNF
jgi:hypothetical protein